MRSKKEGVITVDNIDLDKNTIDLSISVKGVSLVETYIEIKRNEVTFPIKAILYDKEGLQAYDESKVSFYEYIGTYIADVTIESDYRVLPYKEKKNA
jgi:hypothetical protein